jgi:putative oxidoreductase
MTISRRLARPMLASIFVAGGLDAALHPEAKSPAAEKVLSTLNLPAEHTDVVRANGIAQVAAAVLLATGRLPRLASLVLLGSLVPTTLAGHRFWEEDEPAARAGQRIHFLKNLSLAGGLLIAAMDTEGSPSLGYRARRRAAQVGDVAGSVLPG